MGLVSRSGLLIIEYFDLISNTTLLGFFNGIAFTLYCLCARSLYLQLQDPDKRRQTRFTLTYITLVLFCATVVLASDVVAIPLAYIRHADFPGGPWAYESSHMLAPKRLNIIGSTFNLVLAFLTMAIQVGLNVEWLSV